jgi:outer membrane protein
MKKRDCGRMLVTVGAVLLFVASTAWAAGGTPKIAVVDAVGALQQSQWGKQATEELKKQAEKLDADLDQKQRAFGAKKEEFDKKQGVLDAKAKTQKEQELRDMQQEGQKFLMESKGKLNELQAALAKKVHDVVEKISKDEKYDFVFEKSSLVFSTDKDEITKRVASELDKLPPFRP